MDDILCNTKNNLNMLAAMQKFLNIKAKQTRSLAAFNISALKYD